MGGHENPRDNLRKHLVGFGAHIPSFQRRKKGYSVGSGGPCSPSPIVLERKRRTPGILNLYEFGGVLAPPEVALNLQASSGCQDLSCLILTVALRGRDRVLVVYKRKPSQKNRVNIFKLWHKHPSLKLVFLLLGILPAHQKGGPDVWVGLGGVGGLRIQGMKVISQGNCRRGVGGLGWRRIWKSFLEKGAGWWNREEGAVQPRGAVRVRVAPERLYSQSCGSQVAPRPLNVPRTVCVVFRPV